VARIITSNVLLYPKALLDALFPRNFTSVDEKGMSTVQIADEQVEVVAPCQGAWDHYKLSQTGLNTAIARTGLEPVEGIVARLEGGNYLPLYRRTELDAALKWRDYVPDGEGAVLVLLGDDIVEGVASCQAAWDHYGVAGNTFWIRLNEAGKAPIPDIYANVGRGKAPVYLKADVDTVFAEELKRSLIELDEENGMATIQIEDEPVEVVGSCEATWRYYHAKSGVKRRTFHRNLKKLTPVAGYRGKSSNQRCEVYRKTEVDDLFYRIVDLDGDGLTDAEVDGEWIVTAACCDELAACYGFEKHQIAYYIKSNNIQPIPGIKGRRNVENARPGKLYRLTDLTEFLGVS